MAKFTDKNVLSSEMGEVRSAGNASQNLNHTRPETLLGSARYNGVNGTTATSGLTISQYSRILEREHKRLKNSIPWALNGPMVAIKMSNICTRCLNWVPATEKVVAWNAPEGDGFIIKLYCEECSEFAEADQMSLFSDVDYRDALDYERELIRQRRELIKLAAKHGFDALINSEGDDFVISNPRHTQLGSAHGEITGTDDLDIEYNSVLDGNFFLTQAPAPPSVVAGVLVPETFSFTGDGIAQCLQLTCKIGMYSAVQPSGSVFSSWNVRIWISKTPGIILGPDLDPGSVGLQVCIAMHEIWTGTPSGLQLTTPDSQTMTIYNSSTEATGLAEIFDTTTPYYLHYELSQPDTNASTGASQSMAFVRWQLNLKDRNTVNAFVNNSIVVSNQLDVKINDGVPPRFVLESPVPLPVTIDGGIPLKEPVYVTLYPNDNGLNHDPNFLCGVELNPGPPMFGTPRNRNVPKPPLVPYTGKMVPVPTPPQPVKNKVDIDIEAVCDYLSDLCTNMFDVLMTYKPEPECSICGEDHNKSDCPDRLKKSTPPVGGFSKPKGNVERGKSEAEFRKAEKKKNDDSKSDRTRNRNNAILRLFQKDFFLGCAALTSVHSVDKAIFMNAIKSSKSKYLFEYKDILLQDISRSTAESICRNFFENYSKNEPQRMAVISQFCRALPITCTHARSRDGDFLVCVESNPGPKRFEQLIKMIKDYFDNIDFSQKTVLGRTGIFNSAPLSVINPQAHDSAFTHLNTGVLVAENRMLTIDTPIEFFNLFPHYIHDRAGAGVQFPLGPGSTVWTPETGRGPNCVNSKFTEQYDVLGTDLKEVISMLRSTSALWPGNQTVQLWTQTKMLENKSDLSVPVHSDNSGSNAYILSNLMLLLTNLDVSTAMFTGQKHINGSLHKPSTIALNAGNLFPGMAIPGVSVCACSLDDYLQFLNGQVGGTRFGVQNINQNMIFVFATDDMLAPSLRRAFQLYLIAHLPGPVWSSPTVMLRGKRNAANYDVDATRSSDRHITQWSLNGDPFLVVCVVRIPTTAAQGNFGAANPTTAFTFGVLPVNSNANNPFRSVAAAQVPVDIGPSILNIRTALIGPGANQDAFSEAARFWVTQYGSLSELKSALLMTTIKSGYNTLSPFVNSTNIYGAMDLLNNSECPDVTAAPMGAAFGLKLDCFNRRMDGGSNNYSFSFMESHLRAALVMKLRKPVDAMNLILTGFNSLNIFCHVRDMFTAISGFTEDYYVSRHCSWDNVRGLLSNAQTLNDQSVISSVVVVDELTDMLGLGDENSAVIWALPSALPDLGPFGYGDISECIFPVCLVDRCWVAFKDLYDMTSSDICGTWDEEMNPQAVFPVAGGVLGNVQLGIRKSVANLNPDKVKKFFYPLANKTILAPQVPGYLPPEFLMISPDTNIALRVPTPFITGTMNDWRSTYIGTIAVFNGNAIQGPLDKFVIEGPDASTFTWDLNSETRLGWNLQNDSLFMGNGAWRSAFKPQSIPIAGTLYPTVKDNRKIFARKSKVTDGVDPQ